MSRPESRPEGPLMTSVERLRNELDRWMGAAFSQGERALDAIGMGGGRGVSSPIDVVETDEQVHVFVDLPGVPSETVDVTLAGNMLTIKGTKPAPPHEGTAHLTERSTGPFHRAVPMPVPVDVEDVSAESKDGLLHVTLGKAESAKARQIRVKVESKRSGDKGSHGEG